ncbi:hypothetical protein FACHB389_06380 [Nostoc calcicola FACHB-389]|nr:hypothetical protein FACHB389_06380 [Nostoc calcicola FACHB-389]
MYPHQENSQRTIEGDSYGKAIQAVPILDFRFWTLDYFGTCAKKQATCSAKPGRDKSFYPKFKTSSHYQRWPVGIQNPKFKIQN